MIILENSSFLPFCKCWHTITLFPSLWIIINYIFLCGPNLIFKILGCYETRLYFFFNSRFFRSSVRFTLFTLLVSFLHILDWRKISKEGSKAKGGFCRFLIFLKLLPRCHQFIRFAFYKRAVLYLFLFICLSWIFLFKVLNTKNNLSVRSHTIIQWYIGW